PEAFDVIEHHPSWLADIAGITRKKAAEINRAFCAQNGLRKLMMYFSDELGAVSVSRIYKEWGDKAADIIRENPYRLCDEIYGIGFERADAVARKMGVASDSEFRIVSGLRYALQVQARQNGHTGLPRTELIAAAAERLGLPTGTVERVLTEMIAQKHLLPLTTDEGELIFDEENDRAERYVAKKLHELSGACEVLPDAEIAQLIGTSEDERGIRYAAKQKQAIREALSNGVMILTGGPGTGKTTVVQALIRISRRMDLPVALAAPTGRAAKRLSEATGMPASTIHRLLEMEKTEEDERYRFKRCEMNPLDCKVLIVDEASMIDLPLMEGLLRASPRGTRLILIGDDHQLPSVGCGNVLHDILASGCFPSVCLTEIFRQSESSMIVVNAHRILHGEMPLLHTKNDDSFFLACADDKRIVETLLSLLTVRLPRAYGPDVLEKIQIITPSRKGQAGTEALNPVIRDRINPPSADKKELRFRDTVFREGDKVMQLRNNYDAEWKRGATTGSGIYNGDIGTVTRIDPTEGEVEILFDDRVVCYDTPMLEEIEHAYAITVHKSQGSEYPIVILPLCRCAPLLRTRNLFYTALTRAKEMVIMVGSEEIARDMVDSDRQATRYTGLKKRLLDG
ncbi:MAG: AAA family ATPase, partial [Clostridia bacterium]|nr:AAA family ATPase [Clostridia bacterium]